MTAACGGGTSSVIPGVNDLLIYSSGAVGLATIPAPYKWIIPFLPLIGNLTFHTNQFCASDPPAAPTFTQAEIDALINLQFGDTFTSALAKCEAAVSRLVWSAICQCDGGTVPVLAPLPAPPETISFYSPSGVSIPCATYFNSFQFPWTNIGGPPQNLFGQRVGPFFDALFLPPGATNLRFTTSFISDGDVNENIEFVMQGVNASRTTTGSPWGGAAVVQQLGQTVVTDGPTGPPTVGIYAEWGNFSGNYQTAHCHVTIQLDVYCGQSPAQAVSPCCPPDPILLQLLENLAGMVTLLQRQLAPFAYVPGTNHPGLSGRGEVAVQGLLGAKVTPAAVPSWAGVEVGDPDTLWLDSWINWGNADGWSSREFLRSSPHLSLPSLAGQYTKIGYSLADGLTVDLLELVREP